NTNPRTINSVTITGANSGDFLLSNNCGGTLAAGKSCNIAVRFKPSIAGAESASLTIATSDPVSPNVVPLSGTGTQPVATVSPTSWNFGTVTRGQVSATQTITVTNTGTATLTFSNPNAFQLSGTNASNFRLTNSAPCANNGSLAPGASCSVTVQFAPRTNGGTGSNTATLSIRDNAPNSPQSVTLTGTAK